MNDVLFIIATIFFISTISFHLEAFRSDSLNKPPYIDDQPLISLMIWVIGLTFPVISLLFAIGFNWLNLLLFFVANTIIVFFLNPIFTLIPGILIPSRTGVAGKMINSLILGIIFFLIALVV